MSDKKDLTKFGLFLYYSGAMSRRFPKEKKIRILHPFGFIFMCAVYLLAPFASMASEDTTIELWSDFNKYLSWL